MSSIDYYNTPSQWGQHQFVTLEEVLNNFLMSRDVDDYTGVVPRYKLLYQAKRGIRELYTDVLNDIKVAELELSPRLSIVAPEDFVSYVRISFKDERGQLHPIAIDKSMSIGAAYLQDSNYEILFDQNGCVLKDSGGSNPKSNEPFDGDKESYCRRYHFYDRFSPNVDFSKIYPDGKFNFDRNEGVFYFSSDLESKNIVIEYISDGLFRGCDAQDDKNIKIHKFAESALINYIYYEMIKQRRNVPANEKFRARQEYYNSKRIAKRRMNPLVVADLLQNFKGANRWVKW